MRAYHLIILHIVAALLLCASCSRQRVFDRYEHTPLSGWEKNDTLTFCVPPVSQSGDYGLTLKLRTDNDFPFMAVQIVMDKAVFSAPAASAVSVARHSDTLLCPTTNSRGMSLGKGVNLYHHSYDAGKLHLNAGDSLVIAVRHNMKLGVLPGITEVGITLSNP